MSKNFEPFLLMFLFDYFQLVGLALVFFLGQKTNGLGSPRPNGWLDNINFKEMQQKDFAFRFFFFLRYEFKLYTF